MDGTSHLTRNTELVSTNMGISNILFAGLQLPFEGSKDGQFVNLSIIWLELTLKTYGMFCFLISLCLHGVVLYLLGSMDICFFPLQKVVCGQQAFMGNLSYTYWEERHRGSQDSSVQRLAVGHKPVVKIFLYLTESRPAQELNQPLIHLSIEYWRNFHNHKVANAQSSSLMSI